MNLAILALVTSTSVKKAIANTRRGVSARARSKSKSYKRGSMKQLIGLRCQIGETSPMASSVCARISVAFALPSGPSASSNAFCASMRLPPNVKNIIAAFEMSLVKMMDLAI